MSSISSQQAAVIRTELEKLVDKRVLPKGNINLMTMSFELLAREPIGSLTSNDSYQMAIENNVTFARDIASLIPRDFQRVDDQSESTDDKLLFLGDCYQYGLMQVRKDVEKAAKFYKAAAKNIRAMSSLAMGLFNIITHNNGEPVSFDDLIKRTIPTNFKNSGDNDLLDDMWRWLDCLALDHVVTPFLLKQAIDAVEDSK